MSQRKCLLNILLILLSLFTKLNAQTSGVHVSATLDTSKIRIGEQVQLNFEALVPKDVFLVFPYLPDTLQNIEVVERFPIDTIKTKINEAVKYHQKIIITCFDPGIYMIQPFRFYFGNTIGIISDSAATETLTLRVDTMMVDTTQAIRDIKAPFNIPYSWREAMPYVIMAVAAIAVIAYIIYQRRKRKQDSSQTKIEISPLYAHEIALEALRKIQEQKLWQRGFYKEYHSQVSDTIRTYIEHRFRVNALELPSDDTLDRLIQTGISAEAFEKLRNIFQVADMVKFAKSNPLSTENEMSLQSAFDFLMITKPEKLDETELSNDKKEIKLS